MGGRTCQDDGGQRAGAQRHGAQRGHRLWHVLVLLLGPGGTHVVLHGRGRGRGRGRVSRVLDPWLRWRRPPPQKGRQRQRWKGVGSAGARSTGVPACFALHPPPCRPPAHPPTCHTSSPAESYAVSSPWLFRNTARPGEGREAGGREGRRAEQMGRQAAGQQGGRQQGRVRGGEAGGRAGRGSDGMAAWCRGRGSRQQAGAMAAAARD